MQNRLPSTSRAGKVRLVLTSLLAGSMMAFVGCPTDAPVREQAQQPHLILDVEEPLQVGGAGLQLAFSVAMSDGTPPPRLLSHNIEVINDEVGEDFGDSTEGGSRSEPGIPADIKLLTVFVLDFSDSIFHAAVQDRIQSGVDKYLQALMVKSNDDAGDLAIIKDNHDIAIVQLGRTEKVEVVLGFTNDASRVRQTVGDMVATGGLGTTNLYSGYVLGVNMAEREAVSTELVERAVVLITDGTHQAGNETALRTEALETRDQSTVDIFTIGVEGDYNKERVSELASRPEYFYETTVDGVSGEFQKIAAGIVELASRNYVVGICTPVDIGAPTLTIKVSRGDLFATETLSYSTHNLDGNTTDCDPNEVAKRTGIAISAVPDTTAAVDSAVDQQTTVFRDCDNCPDMIVVPLGSYFMGSTELDSDNENERPRHQVIIPDAFAVGVFEVTFDEWEACVRDGGCTDRSFLPIDKRGRHPVVGSWNDAQAYVAWLRMETGKPYRLLSESEWEYVARAATPSLDDTVAVSSDMANMDADHTLPVGRFRPNAFGLYDVYGNVWEWVQDCYHENYVGAPADGNAWESDSCVLRVLRGGSYRSTSAELRPAYRRASRSVFFGRLTDYEDYGFRVARSMTQ